MGGLYNKLNKRGVRNGLQKTTNRREERAEANLCRGLSHESSVWMLGKPSLQSVTISIDSYGDRGSLIDNDQVAPK